MTDTKQTLLPCPFCGAAAHWTSKPSSTLVHCANEHCSVETVYVKAQQREDAFAAWNRRILPAASKADTPVDDKEHPRFMAGYVAGLKDRQARARVDAREPGAVPKIRPRRPFDDRLPEGLMESDHDLVLNNLDACVAFLGAHTAPSDAPAQQDKHPINLVVTRNGVPLADQAEGVRLFKEACLAKPAPAAQGDDRAALHVGVSATTEGATVCIMQPHADGSTTVIYSETHAIGNSLGRAALSRQPSAPASAELHEKSEQANAWRTLFWSVATELNCLPSMFIDGNEHVIKAARAALAAAKPAPAMKLVTPHSWPGSDEEYAAAVGRGEVGAVLMTGAAKPEVPRAAAPCARCNGSGSVDEPLPAGGGRWGGTCPDCGGRRVAAQGELESAQLSAEQAKDAEIARLNALINNPHTHDFLEAVKLEAAHQRGRWGDAHDWSKSAENWFWLVGYLSGKCLRAVITGDSLKALHHTISSAAALANWHEAIKRDGTGTGAGVDADLARLDVARTGKVE